MTITCTVCGYDKNPDDAEFCDACGSELAGAGATPVPPPTQIQSPEPIDNLIEAPAPPPTEIPAPSPPPTPAPTELIEPSASPPPPPIEIPAPSAPPPPSPTEIPSPSVSAATARLMAKQPNAPVSEFPLDGNAIIGVFDPDMGPVDVDLEDFPGGETVSRNHAEVYPEGGVWKIKDLGSTNGVFIKPAGQTRFGARITTPTIINPGDEIAIAKVRFLFEST